MNTQEAVEFTDLDKALALASQQGEVTLCDEQGEEFILKRRPHLTPVNISELRKWRVKMPNISSDELVESVHEMRAAGYR